MLDLTSAFATFPVLETQRFILQAITADHAPEIFRMMSDPHVVRYYGSLPMQSVDQAIAQVQGMQDAFQQQSGIRWAIICRENGQFIGSGGFWRLINEHARAEIGYTIAHEWWGQGVMTEAATAMLDFGFTQMGLHSIEAQIHPANTGSRRVLEKLGFVQEGYFRQNYYDSNEAGFTDTAVFSLLQSDWASRTARGNQ